MKETEIKYLAGLLDADGSLSPTYNNGYFHLVLSLELAESCDFNGKYIKELGNVFGRVYSRKRDDKWAVTNTWKVCTRRDIEMLVPRLVKHMVIKSNRWSELLKKYRQLKAVKMTKEEYQTVVDSISEDTVKNQNHPTYAWTAGFLDGDGHYMIRNRKRQTEIRCGAVSHESVDQVIHLLHKAFGGRIIKEGNCTRWDRNLGPRDRSFAVWFLKKMVKHSRLKKHKIEKILSIHSQRLNISTPTGEVIV